MTTPETTILKTPILTTKSSDVTLAGPRRQLFIERYVLERASKFDVGKEKEQAWQATLDAESIYEMFLQRDKGNVLSGQSQCGVQQHVTRARPKKSANLDPFK